MLQKILNTKKKIMRQTDPTTHSNKIRYKENSHQEEKLLHNVMKVVRTKLLFLFQQPWTKVKLKVLASCWITYGVYRLHFLLITKTLREIYRLGHLVIPALSRISWEISLKKWNYSLPELRLWVMLRKFLYKQ